MMRRRVEKSGAPRVIARFVAALMLGAVGGALFTLVGSPLPWVLGSMTACAIASIAGLPVAAAAATRRPMAAIIGVVLGCSFHPGLFGLIGQSWLSLLLLPLFLAAAAMLCITWFRRVARFDPATAYFAGMPGGIAEMVIMGSERGADERSVAMIQGARIFLVVLVIPFLIRHFSGIAPNDGAAIGDITIPPDIDLLPWGGFSIVVGTLAARALRVPAWHLMGPMAVSATLHLSGVTDFRVPLWLLAAAQVGLGATIGCRFGGLSLAAFARILGLAAGSTLILLALTFAWAGAMSRISGLDPALLVLAYAPGGLAEMSMAALGLALEPGIVIVHHLVRIAAVIIGAPLAFRPSRNTAP